MFEETKKAAAAKKTGAEKNQSNSDFIADLEQPVKQEEQEEKKEQEEQEKDTRTIEEQFGKNPNDAPDSDAYTEMFNQARKATANDFQEATGTYLKVDTLELHKEYIFVVTAMTTFANQTTGEVIPAVRLMDEDKRAYICAAAVITGVCKDFPTFPRVIKVIYKGKVKSAKGNYYDIKVFTL